MKTPIRGSIRILFDKDKLEETVTLLRLFAGIRGADVKGLSAIECVSEILDLADLFKQRGETRNLFNVYSRAMLTERAFESETWIVLEVSEFVLKHLAAIGVGTKDREGRVAR